MAATAPERRQLQESRAFFEKEVFKPYEKSIRPILVPPDEINARAIQLKRLAQMHYLLEDLRKWGELRREYRHRKENALWAVVFDWYFRMIASVSLAWNSLAPKENRIEFPKYPTEKQLRYMEKRVEELYRQERERRKLM